MGRSRNVPFALYILFAASACFGQNPPQTAPTPTGSAVTIPSYPDTARGLEKLLSEMMRLAKEGDKQGLAAYSKSLVLPNPADWFTSVFGSDLGPQYATASGHSNSTIEASVPLTLASLLKDNRMTIEAHKFENSCDENATDTEYPTLLKRDRLVPLYDARFFDKSNTAAVWSYFAYVDGAFRYVGNLSKQMSPPPKKEGSPQGVDSSTQDAATRIRAGANVQAAKLIHQVQPQYPYEAKAAHIQGKVVIHAIIGKDGRIREEELVQGVCVLAKSAMTAVKDWRYQPTLLEGNPVEVDTDITVIFTLS